MIGAGVLHHQLYIGLPLEARRLTGSDAGTSALFVVSSLITLCLQLPITARCAARYRPPEALALALLTMALAFVPPLAFATAPAAGAMASSLAGTAGRLAPLLLAASLLSLADVIRRPFASALVPHLASHRLVATHFGFYTLTSGLGTTLGNTLMGLTFDLQGRPELAGLPWLCLIALGTAAGVFLRQLDRRGLLR
jgi:MFS family permease